jgi:disulfide bond formation protein DsbB
MIFKRYGLYCAWVLACFGVIGSLFFSEVRHLQPCTLCWYQRLALFPLALILGFGTYLGDRHVVRYSLPLVSLGLLFAFYQIGIQEIPDWDPIELCGAGPDCSEKVLIGLGNITLPMLSALNFLAIAFFLLGTWYIYTKDQLKESQGQMRK